MILHVRHRFGIRRYRPRRGSARAASRAGASGAALAAAVPAGRPGPAPQRGSLRRLRRARRGFAGVVVGDDTAYGGENFLHRRFLRFRRLRHPRILARSLSPPRHRPPQSPSLRPARRRRITGDKYETPPAIMSCQESKANNDLWTLCATASDRAATAPALDFPFEHDLIRKPASTFRISLAAVGDTDADPGIAHLLIVHLRIVDRHVEPEPRHRQPADRRQQGV